MFLPLHLETQERDKKQACNRVKVIHSAKQRNRPVDNAHPTEDRQINRQTGRQTDRWMIDRLIDRRIDRQVGR